MLFNIYHETSDSSFVLLPSPSSTPTSQYILVGVISVMTPVTISQTRRRISGGFRCPIKRPFSLKQSEKEIHNKTLTTLPT